MKNIYLKPSSIIIAAFIFVIAAMNLSCAIMRKDAPPPDQVYRVALINAGAYSALYNQAAFDLGSYRELDLFTINRANQLLSRFRLSGATLATARKFEDVAHVEGLDFALIMFPAPAAYTSGYVGLKSINWRNKTLRTVPAVQTPRRPYGWLVSAKNGWISINSVPPAAYLEVDGQVVGTAPVLLMAEKKEITIRAQWKRDVFATERVAMESGLVVVFAPKEYMDKINKKGIYKRLQEKDEQYGGYMVVGLFIVVLFGGVALMFFNPLYRL